MRSGSKCYLGSSQRMACTCPQTIDKFYKWVRGSSVAHRLKQRPDDNCTFWAQGFEPKRSKSITNTFLTRALSLEDATAGFESRLVDAFDPKAICMRPAPPASRTTVAD